MVILAFESRAVCVALEIGLLASDVFSTLPRPTIVDVIPLTVPVKVGDAISAFKLKEASTSLLLAFESRAVCVALEIGLLASDVFSTLPRPTIVDVIPLTLPLNIVSPFETMPVVVMLLFIYNPPRGNAYVCI